MIGSWIETWIQMPAFGAWVIAFAIQLTIYASLAGSFSMAYGAMLRLLKWGERIDTRPLKRNQVRTEILWSVLTCAIYAGFSLLGMQIAAGALPDSWSSGVLQLAAMLITYDFLTYWSHRLLHTRRFVAFHQVHHQSVRATPWSVYCMHPVEAIINQVQVISFMLIWPTSIGLMLLFQFCAMFGGAIGHSNFDPFGKARWLALPKRFHRFHQRHHSLGRDNFGFAGPHWDAVFGTSGPQKEEKTKNFGPT